MASAGRSQTSKRELSNQSFNVSSSPLAQPPPPAPRKGSLGGGSKAVETVASVLRAPAVGAEMAKGRIVTTGFFYFLTASEHIMLETCSSEEIHDRLKEWWTTEGIVAGLISGLCLTGLVDPPSQLNVQSVGGNSSLLLMQRANEESAVSSLTLLWTAAAVLSLSAMLSTVLLFNSLNSLPKECTHAWVERFMLWLPVPLVLIALATWNCFAAIAYFVYLVYGPGIIGALALVFASLVPILVQIFVLQRGQREIAEAHLKVRARNTSERAV